MCAQNVLEGTEGICVGPGQEMETVHESLREEIELGTWQLAGQVINNVCCAVYLCLFHMWLLVFCCQHGRRFVYIKKKNYRVGGYG